MKRRNKKRRYRDGSLPEPISHKQKPGQLPGRRFGRVLKGPAGRSSHEPRPRFRVNSVDPAPGSPPKRN